MLSQTVLMTASVRSDMRTSLSSQTMRWTLCVSPQNSISKLSTTVGSNYGYLILGWDEKKTQGKLELSEMFSAWKKFNDMYSVPHLDDYGQPHNIILAQNWSLSQSMALLPCLGSAALLWEGSFGIGSSDCCYFSCIVDLKPHFSLTVPNFQTV